MFVNSSGRVVFFNGSLIPESEARISVYDSALMFGDMVFEMTRSFNKVHFKLEEHIERLFVGLKILQIEIPYSIDDMIEICHSVALANEQMFESFDEHRLMINVSRGPLGIYRHLFDEAHAEHTVIVADFPLRWTVSSMAKYYKDGINSVITSQRAIPAHLMDPKIKNRSRMWYQMANIEASSRSGENNWALLLDTDGFIAEGTGDNFFIVKNGVIITPEGRNILRGVSRDYIFEIGKEIGLEVIEKNIEPYDVYCADEAFLTGTPFCILPNTHLNGTPIGEGSMGDVTKKLLTKWSQNVGVDIVSQIKHYGTLEDRHHGGTSPYQFKKRTNGER